MVLIKVNIVPTKTIIFFKESRHKDSEKKLVPISLLSDSQKDFIKEKVVILREKHKILDSQKSFFEP